MTFTLEMKPTSDRVGIKPKMQRTLMRLSVRKIFQSVVFGGWDLIMELQVLTILRTRCLLCFSVLPWKDGRKYYTM